MWIFKIKTEKNDGFFIGLGLLLDSYYRGLVIFNVYIGWEKQVWYE